MYFHLLLSARCQLWNAFRWDGQTYIFQALPLGLQQAPATMTLLLRPVVALIRSTFLTAAIAQYLDDAGLGAPTRAEAQALSTFYADTVSRLGWIICQGV